jgi:hypothetical protein
MHAPGPLAALHIAALGVWIGAGVAAHLALARAASAGETPDGLARRRRAQRLLVLEHAALTLALLSGLLLMRSLGWGLGHARWLGVKLGLVVFLVVPLEAMHAYVSHVWIARGLLQTESPPFSKDLSRGIGMEEMVRTLELLLLGIAVPALIWLSFAHPF